MKHRSVTRIVSKGDTYKFTRGSGSLSMASAQRTFLLLRKSTFLCSSDISGRIDCPFNGAKRTKFCVSFFYRYEFTMVNSNDSNVWCVQTQLTSASEHLTI